MDTQSISQSSVQNKKNRLMIELAGWIKRHPVVAFFIITFAITWGLGLSYKAVMNKGVFLLAPLVFIATCGPALAGITISAISNTYPREGKKRTYWLAFLIAWMISAFVFLANNTFINHVPFSPIMAAFTLISVAPVAFVISMVFSRIPTVKSYMSSLIRLRGVWGWSILALFLTPALALLSIWISSLLGRHPIKSYAFPDLTWTLVGLIIVKLLYQFFFFNATGEEAGWRGFALPRMQSLTSPLIASLVLASLWAPWHFFLWQAEGKPVLSLQFWIEAYTSHIPATFYIVWLYNRSKGSILVAGIAHAAANTTFAFFPNLDWPVYNWTVAGVVLVMILVDRMWKKLPSSHPAVYSLICLPLILLTACQKNSTEIREFDVQASDVTLHGRIAGNLNSGCVLVAINGGPGLTSNYMLDLEQLSGPECAVVTYDQRGLGKSSQPAVPDSADSYTLAKYAEDVEAIRLKLKVERIHIFGHSFGGIVAMQYAVLYPEHVESMIFFGGGPPTWEGVQTANVNLSARVQSLIQSGVIPPLDQWTGRGIDPLLPAYFSDPKFTFPKDSLGSAPEFDQAVSDMTYSKMRELDLRAELAPLKQSVLLMMGRDDPFGFEMAEATREALPNSIVKFVVIDRCGHFWHECPDAFYPRVRDFLRN